MTMDHFAKSVVEDRSRVLHGTWSTLGTRLTVSRSRLEEFVIASLGRFVLQLAAYTRSAAPNDDAEAFLEWVKCNRTVAESNPEPGKEAGL
jgi:hypothetical protein